MVKIDTSTLLKTFNLLFYLILWFKWIVTNKEHDIQWSKLTPQHFWKRLIYFFSFFNQNKTHFLIKILHTHFLKGALWHLANGRKLTAWNCSIFQSAFCHLLNLHISFSKNALKVTFNLWLSHQNALLWNNLHKTSEHIFFPRKQNKLFC